MNGIGSKIQREKGYGHWIWQRISAVFTFFLSIYLTYLITSIGALDYTSAHSFVATPHQGVALCFLIVIGLFHAALGVQMIIEDYIAITRGRRFLIAAARSIFILAGLLSLFSVSSILGLI